MAPLLLLGDGVLGPPRRGRFAHVAPSDCGAGFAATRTLLELLLLPPFRGILPPSWAVRPEKLPANLALCFTDLGLELALGPLGLALKLLRLALELSRLAFETAQKLLTPLLTRPGSSDRTIIARTIISGKTSLLNNFFTDITFRVETELQAGTSLRVGTNGYIFHILGREVEVWPRDRRRSRR
jgi:hypothetical protein